MTDNNTDPFTESLMEIPPDAIRYLGSFLDCTSVLGLSSACQYYHGMFQGNHLFAKKVWKMLCIHRWACVDFDESAIDTSTSIRSHENDDIEGRTSSASASASASTNTLNPWLQEYRRRHQIDHDAWIKLNQVNNAAMDSNDRRTIGAQLIIHRMDIMDLLHSTINANTIDWFDDMVPALIKTGLIRYDVCERFQNLQENDVSMPLEHGAMLIARFYCTNLFQVPDRNGRTHMSMESYVERELDGLAQALLNRLKLRMPDQQEGKRNKNGHERSQDGKTNGNGNSNILNLYPMHLILEEMKHFFLPVSEARDRESSEHNDDSDELFNNSDPVDTSQPFSGNTTAYYSSANSMIHKILKHRKGIPITLAIIYQAIVRRATGIEMDPMGLPGHFMLSTTVNEELVFVDAFDGGHVTSLRQVQTMIATNYDVPWEERFLTPIPKKEVWKRMLYNLLNCQDPPDEKKNAIMALMALGFNAVGTEAERHQRMKRLYLGALCGNSPFHKWRIGTG